MPLDYILIQPVRRLTLNLLLVVVVVAAGMMAGHKVQAAQVADHQVPQVAQVEQPEQAAAQVHR